jgi:hypothetical protein
MPLPRPCLRHARNVWLVRCPDCTAWHLAVELARRTGPGAAAAPPSHPAPRPAAVPVPVQLAA